MKRVAIFGAGAVGKEAYFCLSKDYEIAAFIDNNPALWNTKLLDIQILSLDDIRDGDVDCIIIATIYFQAIGKQLRDAGFKDFLVFELLHENLGGVTYKLFPLPLFELTASDFNFEVTPIEKKVCAREKNEKKRILMIAYSFPPMGGSAVQRPLKFVKYLNGYGYSPVVLTCGRNNSLMGVWDESLEKEIPADTTIIRIEDTYSYEDLFSGDKMQEIISFLVQVTESSDSILSIFEEKKEDLVHMIPDARLFWEVKCLKVVENLLDMDSIDAIWTTVPVYSANLLGCYFKKRYGIPWVADYRDLWTSNRRYCELYTWFKGKDIDLQRKIEATVVDEADAIVVAGKSWKKTFEDTFGVPSNKLYDITNGYDEDDFKEITEREVSNVKFTMCYNGRMNHQCRNPKNIIQIVNELIFEGSIDKDRICWVINGQISPQFQKEIESSDVNNIICANGVIGHKECIQSGIDSDMMVFYGESGENGWLNYPGKFYEYLRIGRPILCLSGHNSFQEEVLNETGLGKNFDFNECDQIKKFILDQYQDWINTHGNTKRIRNEKIAKYDRKHLTGNLAEIFNRIINSKNKDN